MGKETFLARQPIVDAEHRLFAYELLFRQSMAAVSAQITSQLQAGIEVISNTLCLGPDWLLQGKLAFINLDEATLMSDFVCLLPPRRVVYEILETVPVTPVLIARYAADIASSPQEVNLAQMQSLAWAEELTCETFLTAVEPATP